MTIYARDNDSQLHYKLTVTPEWARKHDNGALVSCGLTIPDDLSVRSLAVLMRMGKAVIVPKAEWDHSGCQSRCIQRGDDKCQW